MAKIYWVRHGSTDLNDQDCLRGWANVPLNEKGQQEAETLAEALQGCAFTTIYSSDLFRAVQTSEAIRRRTSGDLIVLKVLRPINFGDWDGKPLSEVGPKMEDLMRHWEISPDTAAPNGESFTSFESRQIAFIEGVLRNLQEKEKICVSAHLRNMNYIREYIKNGREPLKGKRIEKLDGENMTTASYLELEYDIPTDHLSIKKVS